MPIIPDRIAAEIATAGTTRRRLTAALIAHGFSPHDAGARAAVQRIQALRVERRERRPHLDVLEKARVFRHIKLTRRRDERKRHAVVGALLALPLALHWRADRRAEIAAACDPAYAHRLAVRATLEAVTRLAAEQWGFQRRRTSKSSGVADSRYLVLRGVGEVRVSDHDIPIYGERACRYAEGGGPRWGEIVVSTAEMQWSVTRWRREMVLRAAGRR